MKVFSTDKAIRNVTKQDIKNFNNQSLTTPAKKSEQLVSMMPAIKKTFNLMGDDIVETHRKNGSLKKNRLSR